MVADLGERAADAVGIARVLHCACVGEKFTLPADRGLNHASKQHADRADGPDEQTSNDDRKSERGPRIVFAAAAGARERWSDEAEHDVADHADRHDSRDHRRCARVDAGVAVEDVAVFVRDHALQLVAREQVDAAARDADHRARRIGSGGKRVDRVVVEQIHRRHGHARCDRHFFDDIQKLAFLGIARGRIDRASAEHLCDFRAALRKLRELDQRGDADHRTNDRHHA